jgi:hypothetical protein
MGDTMSQRYVEISKSEMDAVFAASKKPWTETQCGREYAYECTMGCGVTIRVLSSIHVERDTGRGRGQDAIRVLAIKHKADGSTVGIRKSVRVYRTPGWQDRVMTKVRAMWLDILESNKQWRENNPGPAPHPDQTPADPIWGHPKMEQGMEVWSCEISCLSNDDFKLPRCAGFFETRNAIVEKDNEGDILTWTVVKGNKKYIVFND